MTATAPRFGGSYASVLRRPAFRTFWIGFTLSVIGDAMSRLAFTWMVFDATRSPVALGWLTVAFTAPVLVGGLIAGPLLDRFDRRVVMIADNLIRAVVMALVPILAALGLLSLGYLYAAAAVYSLLMMVSLAGSPALVPALVEREELPAANALETLSWTVAGVAGAPLAGLLVGAIGAPAIVAIDAATYLAFALALAAIRPAPREPSERAARGAGLGDAVRLLLGDRVLLATTLMFMAYNVAFGALMVWLPFHAERGGAAGAAALGTLLGVLAAGECVSALLVGALILPIPLGAAIAAAQALAGLSLTLALVRPDLRWTGAALGCVGFFSAPLTIWAQTLRMQVIPDALRGRAFALLRTLMQGATPLGGAIAGFGLDTVLGAPAMIGVTAALMGLPGVFGALVPELRRAGRRPG